MVDLSLLLLLLDGASYSVYCKQQQWLFVSGLVLCCAVLWLTACERVVVRRCKNLKPYIFGLGQNANKKQRRFVRKGAEQHGRKLKACVLHSLITCFGACPQNGVTSVEVRIQPSPCISREPGMNLAVIQFRFPCHQSTLRTQRSFRACIVPILRRNSVCIFVDNAQIRTNSHICHPPQHGHQSTDPCSSIRQTDKTNKSNSITH